MYQIENNALYINTINKHCLLILRIFSGISLPHFLSILINNPPFHQHFVLYCLLMEFLAIYRNAGPPNYQLNHSAFTNLSKNRSPNPDLTTHFVS